MGGFKHYFELLVWLNFGGLGQFIGAGDGVEAGQAGIPLLGGGEALEVGFEVAAAGLGGAVGDRLSAADTVRMLYLLKMLHPRAKLDVEKSLMEAQYRDLRSG